MPTNWLDELDAKVGVMTGGEWEVREGGNFTDFGAPGFIEYCTENSDSATDLKVGSTNVRLGCELLERSRMDAAGVVALRNNAERLIAEARKVERLERIETAARELLDDLDTAEIEGELVDALRKALAKAGTIDTADPNPVTLDQSRRG